MHGNIVYVDKEYFRKALKRRGITMQGASQLCGLGKRYFYHALTTGYIPQRTAYLLESKCGIKQFEYEEKGNQ